MSEIYKPFQLTLTHQGLATFGLKLEIIKACDSFRGIVYSYLQITANKPTPYPVVPDGTQAIYISPNGSMVGGAQTQAQDVQLLQPGEYFGIWFYPGALRHFFSNDLCEITGRQADANFLQCSHFSRLHIDIYRYKTFSERAFVCEQWLLNRYAPKTDSKFDHALYLICQSFGGRSVSQVADCVGWSTRHLNRQFLHYTGLSTKTFSQIIRVQYACKKMFLGLNNPTKKIPELGYYDQPHLIKEFRKHLATTPRAFFSRFMSDSSNR